jgi:hypothetical protein
MNLRHYQVHDADEFSRLNRLQLMYYLKKDHATEGIEEFRLHVDIVRVLVNLDRHRPISHVQR